MNKVGFRYASRDRREAESRHRTAAANKNKKEKTGEPQQEKFTIKNEAELEAYFSDDMGRFRVGNKPTGDIDYDRLMKSLRVVGDTQAIGSSAPEYLSYTHPVAKLLHERVRRNSLPGTTLQTGADGVQRFARDDGCRVALAIEGGGMRGCVSAGMAVAVAYLNLTSAFDVVYGSSAGSIIGSYILTGQVPYLGPEVYYDQLTTAGSQFINTKRILRALGFGLLDPRLIKDVVLRSNGKPVLNLPFLLNNTVQGTKRLDWEKFVEIQKVLPMKVVASGLKSEKAVIMDMEGGHFNNLEELTDCMHASCLLPGLTGHVMNLNVSAVNDNNRNSKKFVLGNGLFSKDKDLEPLADALIFEPLPFRSAVEDGATHVLVIRSRPDGVDVSGKGSWLERLIFRRFFLRKNFLPNIFRLMFQQGHKKVYSKDVLELNEEAHSLRDYKDISPGKPHLMTMAVPPKSDEVTKLETARQPIFEGVRRGFARAYDCLVEDPSERGRGMEVAKQLFPDEILDYDPLDIVEQASASDAKSAFEFYLRENNKEAPNVWPAKTNKNEETAVVAGATSPTQRPTTGQ